MRGESLGMKWPPSAQRTPLDCANRRREGNDPHAGPALKTKWASQTGRVGIPGKVLQRPTKIPRNGTNGSTFFFFFFTFVQNTKSFVGVAVE